MSVMQNMEQFAAPEGFEEEATFSELRHGAISRVPVGPGAYLVKSPEAATFTEKSCGGYFKGRDPSVPVELLEGKWVDGAEVVYIGKANDLRRRLGEYTRFGAGRAIGHWGGRYVWQLKGCQELTVTWMATPNEEPRVVEQRLLAEFVAAHGRLPFANLTS